MTDKQAIDVIKSECYVFNPMNMDRTTLINTALDRAVDALKRHQWIPITEKAQDVRRDVLLSFKDGSVITGYLAPNKEWHDSGWEHEYNFDEVNAWMEIPDSYVDGNKKVKWRKYEQNI